jgi:hypothetical protein
MLKLLSVHKKKVIFFSIILLLVIFVTFEAPNIKNYLYKKYPNFSLHKEFRGEKSLREHIENDYNVSFLPNTQFEKLSLIKNKINFKPEYYTKHLKTKNGIGSPSYGSFFIEVTKDNIWIVDYTGAFYIIDKKKINIKSSINITPLIVTSNFSSSNVLDVLIHDNKIFISSAGIKAKCKTLKIFVAEINLETLFFEEFFSAGECGDTVLAGRMQFYNHYGKNGLIFTTHGHLYNKPDNTPQDDNSIYGKIIFVDFKNKKPLIFSKGHRLSQGLFANNDLILQTEHGPRGGDEINKILFGKNYGWPITSYGEKYGLGYTKKSYYKKNHAKYGFEEPVYSFVPSIGISEIIKLPNSFSEHFQNNFILSSLYGRHIYRIKFDNTFKKIIYLEDIFVGERIRDLKYDDKLNLIYLAFEENGEIGIISNKL